MTSGRCPWTSDEDAVLRRLFATKRNRKFIGVDWRRVLRALPGRSKDGALCRLARLGIARGKVQWTAAEDRILQTRWDEDGRRTLEGKLPRRSWAAIARRARALGLPPLPQGLTTFAAACRATGFTARQLRAVLAWAESAGCGVQVQTHSKGIARTASCKAPLWQLVDLDEVTEAVAAWMKLEHTACASRRLGISGPLLRQWMRAEGMVTGGEHLHRRASEVYDRIAAAHGWRPGTGGILAHADRVGWNAQRLRARLVAAGVISRAIHNRAVVWLTDAAVDAVLPKRASEPQQAAEGRAAA